MGTSPPSRRQTTTCSTDGESASASSTTAFMASSLPRRSDPSAVITTFASASRSRAATAGAAKPEKIGTWMAPRCAHACEAIATSGDMGRKIATVSLAPTPSDASPSARRVTSADISAKLTSRRPPFSPANTAATASGRDAAQRCTQFQAMFSVPPSNQVAHSGPRERSMTVSHGVENSSSMSSIAAGQNHSGSFWERRTSSRYESIPCLRMSRTTFACSRTSSDGRQTTSATARAYAAGSFARS